MKLLMTMQQLKKIIALANPKVLVDFLDAEKGAGAYAVDFYELAKVGLVKQIGTRAYVTFEVNGAKPTASVPGVHRKRSANDFSTFVSLWRRMSGNTIWDGQDLGLMKKLVALLSIDEFSDLVEDYMKCPSGKPTVRTLWTFYKTQGDMAASKVDKHLEKQRKLYGG